MVVLDVTIVNIALPHMQRALGFSNTNLAWVVNAYTLTFGGLLLLGGRMGDILGRRRVFLGGIALFTLASLLGGLAQSEAWLLAARALQGMGAAVMAPTALALITTNFEEGPERNRAFGVYAAVAGSGAAIGLLAGGMLTSWLSWRWVLFVNAPIGVLLFLLVPMYIAESERHPGRFDLAGAVTSTLGMASLVFGFTRVATPGKGWSDGVGIASFAAAVLLLAAFIVNERRQEEPITPLRMFANRNRAGTYVVMLGLAAGMFGMFFYLVQFVQEVMGYSALKAGFAFLPISAVIVVAAQIAARFVGRLGPKPFMVGGAAFATIGMVWLTRLDVGASYAVDLLIPTLIFGFGMGLLFVPITLTAVSGIAPHESGAASGLLNVMQQIGGALGLSILVTIYSSATTGDNPMLPATRADGTSAAFVGAVVFAAVALVAALLAIQAKASDVDSAASAPAMG